MSIRIVSQGKPNIDSITNLPKDLVTGFLRNLVQYTEFEGDNLFIGISSTKPVCKLVPKDKINHLIVSSLFGADRIDRLKIIGVDINTTSEQELYKKDNSLVNYLNNLFRYMVVHIDEFIHILPENMVVEIHKYSFNNHIIIPEKCINEYVKVNSQNESEISKLHNKYNQYCKELGVVSSELETVVSNENNKNNTYRDYTDYINDIKLFLTLKNKLEILNQINDNLVSTINKLEHIKQHLYKELKDFIESSVTSEVIPYNFRMNGQNYINKIDEIDELINSLKV